MENMAVLAGLKKIRDEIDRLGIAKVDRAEGEGVRFNFRGVDAVLDTFSGLLAAANVLAIPSYSGMRINKRPTRNGRTYHASVMGSFRIKSLLDGSEIQMGDFFGEANDTQDKAIAKAQSISLRQFYLQTFCVPLGSAMDPENGDSAGADTRPPLNDSASGPQARSEPAKQQAKPNKKSKAQPTNSTAPRVSTPLLQAQRKILDVKLRNCGATEEEVEKLLGAAVCNENFNAAMDIIQDLSRGGID